MNKNRNKYTMSYENAVAFRGNFEKAIETARNTLLPHGFKIVNQDAASIELEGTRSILNKGEDPLAGISWIHIQSIRNSLVVKAELGVIKNTIKLMTFITTTACIVTLVILGIVFLKQQAPLQKYLILLVFIPTPIVLFITAKIMKYRTTKALDILLDNMVASVQ